MLLCYYVTMLLCYYVTMLLCYHVTMLPCYYVTALLCYCLTVVVLLPAVEGCSALIRGRHRRLPSTVPGLNEPLRRGARTPSNPLGRYRRLPSTVPGILTAGTLAYLRGSQPEGGLLHPSKGLLTLYSILKKNNRELELNPGS